ncbi:hypothetical protein [Acidiphilium acidophilum]|uniref:Transposase n=1 Tax=Acidiphilium acidophilum TaxID=76588 RepID=A0AAW9DPH9_ACIAO|nr:hypothetical protein [Acidiphilium acidophilum]MDX5931064.1 hypothetical protein [Acidiphilium acidophilum]
MLAAAVIDRANVSSPSKPTFRAAIPRLRELFLLFKKPLVRCANGVNTKTKPPRSGKMAMKATANNGHRG